MAERMSQASSMRTSCPISDQQMERIQCLASTLRFGSINLVFQDGKLIQIDKNEKIRIR